MTLAGESRLWHEMWPRSKHARETAQPGLPLPAAPILAGQELPFKGEADSDGKHHTSGSQCPVKETLSMSLTHDTPGIYLCSTLSEALGENTKLSQILSQK